MAGVLSAWQTRPFTAKTIGGNGMQYNNNLGYLLQKKPQRATDTMVELFAYNRGKTLFSELYKLPVKYFDTDDDYYWDVIGSARRNIPLVECRDEYGNVVTVNSTNNVGVGKATFELVFAEDYFGDSEIIVGNLKEQYQFRILCEKPRMEGTNYVYTVQIFGLNQEGCPVERLLPGERFSYLTAFVEKEQSRKAGTVNMATTTSMRNHWSSIRLFKEVNGSDTDRKLAVGIPITKMHEGDKTKGQVIDTWITWVEYELERKWQEYMANAVLYGKNNIDANGESTDFGKSGNRIEVGSGLYEQLEAGNYHSYSKFSLKQFTAAITDLFVGTGNVAPNDRHVEVITGTYGAQQLSEAIEREALGWSKFEWDAVSMGAIQKAGANNWSGKTTNLKAGYAFTEYIAPGGVHITIRVNPMYDDIVDNKVKDSAGRPLYSFRYDIMDLGSGEGQNIFLCKKKGAEDLRWYVCGPRNPFTGETREYSHTEIDKCQVHRWCPAIGVCVLDPTRTMSFVPTGLLG